MEPTASQVRNHYSQKNQEAHLERALARASQQTANLHCRSNVWTSHPTFEYTVGDSYISNNCGFHQKHPGVPDSSDGSDGTLYPLTENYTLPVAQATGRIAYVPLYIVVKFTHHQKDTCVTLFAGAAVMLKRSTQRLAMWNHSYYVSFNDFQNICVQCVFSSMYLYSYLSTHGISGLAARGECQQFEVRLKMTIEWTQRYTPRPWSSEFGDALVAGYDCARLEEYLEVVDLEAVDGRRARCWDSIHRVVNSKPWECDEVSSPLQLLWRTGWWRSIVGEVHGKLKLHSGVNSKSREWRDARQS